MNADSLQLPMGFEPRAGEQGTVGTFGQSPTTGTDTWLTPRHIIDALGPFDLDPCAAPAPRPWPTAAVHRTERDGDGLAEAWHGIVWLNPPFSDSDRWLRVLSRHGSGIALIPARLETALWRDHIWPTASLVALLNGRQRFHHADGTPAPFTAATGTALVAYGDEAAARLRAACGAAGPLDGVLLTDWSSAGEQPLPDGGVGTT